MKKILTFITSIGICLFGCQKHAEKQQNVIILLGPPGAGKGTQAVELCKELKIPHISTGDLFRDNLSRDTEIGKKAKEYMSSGKLVPDEVVLSMLFERISREDCKKGYLLDGFPRTIEQAEAFDKKIKNNQLSLTVININVPDAILIDRITGRLSCKKCGAIYHKKYYPPKISEKCDKCSSKLIQREDDSEEVLKERLQAYHKQTQPLIDYYKKRNGFFFEVDGQMKKDEILKEILKIAQRKD